ncbi:MAG: MFS transporter [Candidatus Thermoplasmatota archaeon]|nr:MFS transporter [Candidatus Thermoplasmatota archaeon]
MSFKDIVPRYFKRFSPQYWVVISLELFERGAYYGIMGYFPVHALYNLGFSGKVYGALYALLVFLLYFVPIVSASLAKKIGYKRILTIAFLILIPSYLGMTFLTTELSFFFAIVAWGIGAGAFKPMVSATIAHVTGKEERNSAYSIYYLSINWGSFLAMLATGFLIPQHFAQIVFAVGAVLITVNLIITLLFYRDPIENDPNEKVSSAFKKMGIVLSDRRFVLLLLFYSGFFVIFSSMHTFIPAYYFGFGIQPARWFTAPLISAINPLTIITIGPILAKFTDRFDSLKLMITGMLIFSAGLFIIGMIPLWYAMAIGIFVYSIGEFVTHPSFISFVSKIAPEERVALYMGYAFLPSAFGNVVGSLFGGIMWDSIAVNNGHSRLFWAIYVSIGLLTMGGFLIYNRIISPKTEDVRAVTRGFFGRRTSFLAPWSFIPIVLIVGVSLGRTGYVGDPFYTEENGYLYDIGRTTISFSGTLSEGENHRIDIPLSEENILWVNITLSWSDEPDQTFLLRTFENQPDLFEISFIPCNATELSETGANPRNGVGEMELSHHYGTDTDPTNGTGIHSLEVVLVDVGDYQTGFDPPVYLPGRPRDSGNAYDITVQYDHLIRVVPTDL